MRAWSAGVLVALHMIVVPAVAAELDEIEQPPAGWTGPVFVPSFGYPTTAPAAEARPWESVDFRTDARSYMEAVFAYVLEGQDRSTWRIQDNTIRPWFHAPWMGPGGSGREFIAGLTRERSSRPGELGAGQTKCRQNWAVGFYNPAGGYALGRIWAPVQSAGNDPDLTALPFPVGTVVAKLLFTEADATEVPLLAGAPEIQANIHVDPNPNDDMCPPATVGNPAEPAPRAPAMLRLLQFDVAVRDARADVTTGWVFGTFVYDGRKTGTDPWAKLDPVGLMWGNDPDLTDTDAAAGEKPAESIVLSDFGLNRAFGRGGRMNGPVDNSVSACLSCHMTAQWPNPANMTPRGGTSWDIVGCWFRNLGPDMPFGREPTTTIACGSSPTGATLASLDFSLQLGVGMRNWQIARATAGQPFSISSVPLARGAADAVRARAFDGEVLTINGVQSLPVHRGESPAEP